MSPSSCSVASNPILITILVFAHAVSAAHGQSASGPGLRVLNDTTFEDVTLHGPCFVIFQPHSGNGDDDFADPSQPQVPEGWAKMMVSVRDAKKDMTFGYVNLATSPDVRERYGVGVERPSAKVFDHAKVYDYTGPMLDKPLTKFALKHETHPHVVDEGREQHATNLIVSYRPGSDLEKTITEQAARTPLLVLFYDTSPESPLPWQRQGLDVFKQLALMVKSELTVQGVPGRLGFAKVDKSHSPRMHQKHKVTEVPTFKMLLDGGRSYAYRGEVYNSTAGEVGTLRDDLVPSLIKFALSGESRDGGPEAPQATAGEGDLGFLSIVLLTEFFGTGINVGTAVIGSLGGLALIYLRRKLIPEVGMPKEKAN